MIDFQDILEFLRTPHVPWRIIHRVKPISPKLARILTYGRINPNTQKYWNQIYLSGKYEQAEDSRYNDLRKEILKRVPCRSKVLDVGCGTGKLMEILRTHNNCECIGVDISEVAVKIVQQKGFEAFQCKVPSFPVELATDTFDVCTMTEILEHLDDPLAVLKRVSDLVKPGGLVIATVPEECMKPEEFDEHMHSFSQKSLCALMGSVYIVEQCQTLVIAEHSYLLVCARNAK